MRDITSKVKLTVVATVFATSSFGSAHAAGVSTLGCLSTSFCTMDELFKGGSLTVDDKMFKDFFLAFDLSATPRDFTKVTVTGLSGGGLDPGPGLRVDGNGEFKIKDFENVDFGYLFTVNVLDPALRVKDNTLTMGPYAFTTIDQGAHIEINETVNNLALDTIYAQKQVFADDFLGTSKLSDNKVFAPFSAIRVGTAVNLEGFALGDTADLTSFTQNFSQVAVPVPAALWLFVSGLAGLGVFSTRRKSVMPNVACAA